MSDEKESQATMVVASSRFGDLTVPVNTLIEIPNGLIGFPKSTRFIMIDHKPPFSWLHSVDDPNLAFVVVDGFEFGASYDVKPPQGDKDCDFQEKDEYAILVVVTVRPDPRMTTANLKAPLFVNLKNRKGVQVIFDSPRFSTRYPLWAEEGEEGEAQGDLAATDKPDKADKK
ncbi:MAG: flagellar assembly protein FliW [Deltaproteobacteria bacterium]|nr:flagellar assembly protein FliW [Deltaproteobacteria bacterium]